MCRPTYDDKTLTLAIQDYACRFDADRFIVNKKIRQRYNVRTQTLLTPAQRKEAITALNRAVRPGHLFDDLPPAPPPAPKPRKPTLTLVIGGKANQIRAEISPTLAADIVRRISG